jgi:carbon storage regulator
MLVLSRKIGEVITVGNDVRITVLSFDRGVVRLGIEAPKNIPVHRKEVFDKIIQMNRQASKTELNAFKSIMNSSQVDLKAQRIDSIPSPSINYAKRFNEDDKV